MAAISEFTPKLSQDLGNPIGKITYGDKEYEIVHVKIDSEGHMYTPEFSKTSEKTQTYLSNYLNQMSCKLERDFSPQNIAYIDHMGITCLDRSEHSSDIQINQALLADLEDEASTIHTVTDLFDKIFNTGKGTEEDAFWSDDDAFFSDEGDSLLLPPLQLKTSVTPDTDHMDSDDDESVVGDDERSVQKDLPPLRMSVTVTPGLHPAPASNLNGLHLAPQPVQDALFLREVRTHDVNAVLPLHFSAPVQALPQAHPVELSISFDRLLELNVQADETNHSFCPLLRDEIARTDTSDLAYYEKLNEAKRQLCTLLEGLMEARENDRTLTPKQHVLLVAITRDAEHCGVDVDAYLEGLPKAHKPTEF